MPVRFSNSTLLMLLPLLDAVCLDLEHFGVCSLLSLVRL